MCGLAGILLSSQCNPSFSMPSLLRAMGKALYHRGPDNEGIYIDDTLGLTHQRLSILDLSERASQPMISQNARYVLAYNGEIYNYKNLQARYLKNTILRSASDTEVLLELISEIGLEASVKNLNGMFAFALWDKHEKVLYLARDRMGIKPLYWSIQNKAILFGSEIKPFLCYSDWKGEINTEALQDYFSQYYIRSPQTIYQSCYKVQPGTIIAIQGKDLSYQTSRYYQLEDDKIDLASISFEDAENELDRLLTESIRSQLVADVPVAAFLSGGVDSSLIVSKILEFKKVSTFSIGYHEKAFDESDKSSQVAKILGSDHYQHILSADEAFTIVDRLPQMYDEPFADASQIPTHFVSRLAREKAKVVLSGDGADELFAGYQRYSNSLFTWNKIDRIPSMVRLLARTMLRFFPDALSSERIGRWKRYIACRSILEYHFVSNHIGMGNPVYRSRVEETNCAYSNSFLDSLLMDDQSFRLPDGMLTKVDRASMAASLEVRIPFLDNKLITLAHSLPEKFLNNHFEQKRILKSLLKRRLPESIVDAPKVGFHIPIRHWLRKEWRPWANDYFYSASIKAGEQFLDMSGAQEIWNRFLSGDDHLTHSVWGMLMYFKWKEQYTHY